jgi:hypothetical protein
MGTWTTSAKFDGNPQALMAVLTEVEAIERWSPVPFHLPMAATGCAPAGA